MADEWEALDDVLNDYPLNYQKCREGWHPWQITSQYRIVDTYREERYPVRGNAVFIEQVVTCARCGEIRHDYYNKIKIYGRTGLRKIGTYYQHPPGYALKGIGSGASGVRELFRGMIFDQIEGGKNEGGPDPNSLVKRTGSRRNQK